MNKRLLLLILSALSSTTFVEASRAVPEEPSDLWFFQLSGPVKSIEIESIEHIHADFDRQGRITYMRYGAHPVTIHRNQAGRIDSITCRPIPNSNSSVRIDDAQTTKYRQRATDERGNWIARKTQRPPYIITTEHCTTIYYK